MLSHVPLAYPDDVRVSYAERIARIAQSPAAQAIAAAAPSLTRQQLDLARAAVASANLHVFPAAA